MLNFQLSINNYQLAACRFTSTDMLFEKYPGWSPYQYSMNNPINLLDWNGRELNNAMGGGEIEAYAAQAAMETFKVYNGQLNKKIHNKIESEATTKTNNIFNEIKEYKDK